MSDRLTKIAKLSSVSKIADKSPEDVRFSLVLLVAYVHSLINDHGVVLHPPIKAVFDLAHDDTDFTKLYWAVQATRPYIEQSYMLPQIDPVRKDIFEKVFQDIATLEVPTS